MIITKKHLIEIESAVGHGCEASVLAGSRANGIAVRVSAIKPNGQTFNCQEEFTAADFLNNECDRKLERFKRWAKAQFDTAFEESQPDNASLR